MDRVETGALQINDDWPGVFVRGDDCIQYSMMLNHLNNFTFDDTIEGQLLKTSLEHLHGLFTSAVVIGPHDENYIRYISAKDAK